jgi:Tfp pilus assembly protein PilV
MKKHITRGRRRERGFAVAYLFVVIVFVGIALQGVLAVMTYNAVAAEYRRNRQQALIAAQNALDRQAMNPATSGGSIDTDASGFSDIVVLDTRTGAVTAYSGTPPAGAVIVRRRWTFFTDGAGRRHCAAAAQTVGADLQPLTGPGRDQVVVEQVQPI